MFAERIAAKKVKCTFSENTRYSLPFTHVPGLVPFLRQTSVDWQFVTVPQEYGSQGIISKVNVVCSLMIIFLNALGGAVAAR